jgi:micrococcal nuclease
MRRPQPYLVAYVGVFAVAGALLVVAGHDRDGSPRLMSTTVARLLRVIDGDTVRVRQGGRETAVRLVGIDTPETHRPGSRVECGGRQATAHLKRLVRPGERVELVPHPTRARRDRYGRRLAYVELRSGRDLARTELRAGWATVYAYHHRPFARMAHYRAAARAARDEHKGIYALCGRSAHHPAARRRGGNSRSDRIVPQPPPDRLLSPALSAARAKSAAAHWE